jgi:hypothetical protein
LFKFFYKALLAHVSFFKFIIKVPSVSSTPIISGIDRSNVPNVPFILKIELSFVTSTALFLVLIKTKSVKLLKFIVALEKF